MTTTTNNDTYSLATLGRQIDLNKKSGWGLQNGTSEQLNLLALYCQHLRLLPGEDITLYEGKPYITIDGRVKLMRRHPDFRTFKNRPLTVAEKEQWGYDADDLVVECTVTLKDGTEFSARGMVRKAERYGQQGGGRQNPIARTHPVELAEKRAVSRAERYAFGADKTVDDETLEQTAQVVIEQRQDPERRQALAAEYDRVVAEDGSWPTPTHTVDTETGEVTELDEQTRELLEDNQRLREACADQRIPVPKTLRAEPTWTLQQIHEANAELGQRLESRKSDAVLAEGAPLL